MKKRILEQLFGLANGLKSSDSYLEELLKITSKNEAEIRRAAREALTNIIHDYSRFRIETIDSFSSRSCATLPVNWNWELICLLN